VKGVIYNLVEEVVRRERGVDTWDDVVDEAGVSGAYTSLGTYPDSDMDELAGAVARQVGTDASSVVRHVGQEGLAILATRYPQFFEPHDDLFGFLRSLNDVVHPEVRRLYPGAFVPTFDLADEGDDVLVMTYASERGRCDLAEGLVLGAARWYRQEVVVEQPRCVRRGDDVCDLRVVRR
jgi:hypothetical protein